MLVKLWNFSCVLAVCLSNENVRPSHYYTVGTVEFNVFFASNSPRQIIQNNLNSYLHFIDLAQQQNVDVLVFPEATLNYHGLHGRQMLLEHAFHVPNPEENIAPCDYPANYSEILNILSKKCRESKIYVLINIVEKVECNSCQGICSHPHKSHHDGYDLFNTNIVLDRRGRIISRYRKFNLFLEPSMDEPRIAELAIFRTDFNVAFGHFICFDILFKDPAMRLLKEENITNILYPTMWFSDLPFLTSEQIHQAWAYANKVNLIVSGASNPLVGSTGSGIYLGDFAIDDIIMSPNPVSKLFTRRMPKYFDTNLFEYRIIPPNSRHTPVEMQSLHITEIWTREDNVRFEIVSGTQTICVDENLCCTFSSKVTYSDIPVGKVAYKFMYVANYTTRIYGTERESGEVYCAILACTTENPKSCGRRFKDNRNLINAVKFENVSIKAQVKFTRTDDVLIMPTSLDTSILPLDINRYTFRSGPIYKQGRFKYQDIEINSTVPLTDMLTFGIYGRNFALDRFHRHRA